MSILQLVSRDYVALGKLVNLLEAKVEQRGGQVIKVGRFFPGSQDLPLVRLEVGSHGIV